jgi:hypothetical protein
MRTRKENHGIERKDEFMETKISRRKLMPSLGAAGAAMMVGNNLLSKPTTAAAHTISDAVFNVKNYGAVGDNVANDTAAIQAAVNAAGLVNGTVFFPSGTYKITQINVNVPSAIKLEGIDASTTGSRLASATNAPMLYVTSPCTIENLALVGAGNDTFTLQDGIFIDNTNDVYVRNVFLAEMYNCVHIKDSVFYSFFDNVRFYSAENCLVYGDGTAPEGYAVQFNNCQATINHATYGFFFDNCGSVIIDSLLMSPAVATDHGIVFNTLAPLAGIQQISNTVIEGARQFGLYLKGTEANPIRFVFVSNSYMAGDPSVMIDYGKNVYFDNCYFTGSGTVGSNRHAVKTSYKGDNVMLSNCEFQVINVPITAGLSCSSVSYDVVNPVYEGGFPFIYLPFLPQSNVKRISVMGGKMGGSANPIDLLGDYTNAIANVFGYKKLQNEGIHVADGAPVLTYYIPHGLAATPRSFNVQEGSQALGHAEIHCVERDATNLIVSLKNFPAIGVNNLVFIWSAKV